MRLCEVSYWGNKAQVALMLRNLPPEVFNYGETKTIRLPFGVDLGKHYKVKEITAEKGEAKPQAAAQVVTPRKRKK